MKILEAPIEPADADLRALLAAVPADPLAAFVLADYLQERSDPDRQVQGELLRAAYALTRSAGGDGRSAQEDQLRTLLRDGVQAVGPYRRVVLDDESAMTFAWVPPGAFLMGSPDDEEGRAAKSNQDNRYCLIHEGPRHEVVLTRGFWMGTTPVTQSQFAWVMGRNPSWDSDKTANVESKNRDVPVQEVVWPDVTGFLRRLSKRLGTRFRLPTEAEWEYACRAGTTTRFWSGDTVADLARVAWYDENTPAPYGGLQPAGGKPANAFGLHDMHGNLWEYCADVFAPSYYARSPKADPRCRRSETVERAVRHVVRGGDAWDDAANCRSAARDDMVADCSHNDIGFRAVADQL